MTPRLVEARYKDGYTIWIRFADGVSGDVNLQSELWGEVFEPLKNLSEFRKFKVDEELQTLVWPNGADFAPEFLYSKLQPGYTLEKPPKSGVA
ncbi:MAG: DUF2442 domain-containing protein [Gammaproteobacteria bacterium]|nr:DUF2442 domain-containing protein [Gammaproteobacteria bacterium]